MRPIKTIHDAQKAFPYLAIRLGCPKMVTEGLLLLGTSELAGRQDNPTIMAWADEIGGKVDDVYTADEVPWCGLFMAIIAKRAGKRLPIDPLWALNWGTFGSKTDTPMLGDVLVFSRKTKEGKKAGHVCLYIAEDSVSYHVLGGNQEDCVCIVPIEKNRLYVARRPKYRNQPAGVKDQWIEDVASKGRQPDVALA